jgi:outer membrane protein assembly factor BamB
MPSASFSATNFILVIAVFRVTLVVAINSTVPPLWSTTVCSGCTFGDPFLFTTTTGGYVLEQVAVVVIDGAANTTSVASLNATNGKVLWQTQLQNGALQPYSGWCDGVPVASESTFVARIVCGTASGVVAVNATTGEALWRYTSPLKPPAGLAVPAHPTVIPAPNILGGSIVAFTFESGHNSTPLIVLRGIDGLFLSQSREAVFTKIWRVAAVGHVLNCAVMTFCAVDLRTGNISVALQRVAVAPDGHVQLLDVWRWAGLGYSPPGLWDNPNLDVDASGRSVFMYQKLRVGFRRVLQLDAATGTILWTLPSSGHVPDYDTYAFNNDFYRLISDVAGQSLSVEKFNCTSIHSEWSLVIPCRDMGAILLVGGPAGQEPHVFVFALDSGSVWGRAADGREVLIATLSGLSTGVVAANGTALLLGHGGGVYTAYSLH